MFTISFSQHLAVISTESGRESGSD